MRYLLALICPPAALWRCRRWGQAIFAAIAWLAGLATLRWGIGFISIFFCMMWATNAVGDDRAAAVTARFVRSLREARMHQRRA